MTAKTTPAKTTPAKTTPAKTTPAKTTPARPTVTDSPAVFNAAVKSARAAAGRADSASWIIGDAANKVQGKYGENTLADFADAIGASLPTVRNLRTMADRYPVADIKRDLQHATVYGIFASQDDRFALISKGNAGQPWTVSAARDLVKSRKDVTSSAGAGEGDGEGSETGADIDPRIALQANVDRLTAELAKARTALVKYDAEHPDAAKVAAKAAATHTHRGIPAHTASEPRTDCPTCRANGVSPATAKSDAKRSAKTPRSARTAKPAAALAA